MAKVLGAFIFLLFQFQSIAQQNGIINNANSPYVQMKSVNIGDCKWTEGFWAEKFDLCAKEMVPYMEELLTGDTGHALNNFKIAAGMMEGEHKGMRWHDGDFYKWIEAALYVYAQTEDIELLKRINGYIKIIAGAQMEDGYLQTQAQLRDDIERYDNRRNHEMYNSGHLLTSACIHYRITGKRNFLDIAINHADLMYVYFNPESKHYSRFGFNQTQIMGLVELYRTTKDRRYLELAEKFINRRGQSEVVHQSTTLGYPIGDMVQERTPLRESEEAVGHAVLALYYYAGAADVYAETGEQALLEALDKLHHNITEQKMYVTGAVGQAHYGVTKSRDKIQEGFIDEYMMPNLTAYNETCANVCNAMFNYRMLQINGDSKHADIMELVLYNSALSGIGLSGRDYFYANPLRMIHDSRDLSNGRDVTESDERMPYLNCFCCPPNLVRTIAKLSGWAYGLTKNGLAVNLYGGNMLHTKLLDGSTIRLQQSTNYPWAGNIQFEIQECTTAKFEILFRIPEWAENTTVLVNGKPLSTEIIAGQYLKVSRKWKTGDSVNIQMPMPPTLVEGHPRIEEVRNQVAVMRGPVVYCLESPDLPKGTSISDAYLSSTMEMKPVSDAKLLGGVTTIESQLLLRTDSGDGMYRRVSKPTFKTYDTRLIPYHVWSNRGKAEMTVFLPVVWN